MGVSKILKFLLLIAAIFLIAGGIYIFFNLGAISIPLKNNTVSREPPTEENPSQNNQGDNQPKIPESASLDIPFITQAPFRAWKEYPFNHTCEEASVLQVHYYFSKEKIEESKIRQELLDLVDFQVKNYGFHEDTSAAQTAKLIEDYYGYKAKVYYDISLEDIKKEIVAGNPVILPTAGRLLENPYFTPPGPLYHMIVVKGYNKKEFITNDPGTYSKGVNFPYSYQILTKAIHDWNDGDVLNGKSAMIVIYPPQD